MALDPKGGQVAISKRLRYEVLRRDNYTCRYCGHSAPDVKVTVDHVIPKALGGTDDPANLCAACADCNGGKTSSSPDAPLVADVAEDALQWSRAMQAATSRMLADLDARSRDREQFRKWWDVWGIGQEENRRPIPKGSGWEQTVDQLVSAGLPLRVLKDCIDIAMSKQKVTPDQTFRYMCGIAWKKLSELQDAARAIAGMATGDEGEPAIAAPALMSGRADFARELLRAFPGEIPRLRAEAREDRGAVTDDEQDVEAMQVLWQEQHIGYSWLTYSVCDMFMRSTDAILISSARSARKVLYDECGPEFSEKRFAEKALDFAANAYQARAAEGYLGAMSGDHRTEWEEFAESFYGPEGLRWDHPVIYIARCARGFLENGQRYWPAMCHGRGVHIPLCPSRGTHFVRFAELECCQRADDEHNDHLYCDRHFDAATAGELGNASGPVTVASHTPVTEPIEAVPF